MTTLDVGIAALRSTLTALRAAADRGFYDRTSATLKGVMPKGLYARAVDHPPFNSLFTLRYKRTRVWDCGVAALEIGSNGCATVRR